jgi:pimeloyl-ACP methyl ester carboxylesterase
MTSSPHSMGKFAAVAFAVVFYVGLPRGANAQDAAPVRTLAPEDYSLTTKDGVQLQITFYPSTVGPQAVPVVMLHDFNGTRAVFASLATLLQVPTPELAESLPPGPPLQGCAVVTVDLRGHGGSKNAVYDDQAVELDAAHFQLEDYQDMVLFDMEAVRAFLVAQNDAGRLNLNKLCVVGAGMGANVALAYAARDWSIPPLAARKQGQDVKALVLLSPTRNFHGLSSIEPLKFPPVQQRMSIYLAYGAGDPKVAKDCKNIAKIFERYHPEPPREMMASRKDFFTFAPNTPRQGTELLTSEEFGQAPRIAGFIEMRLGRRDFPHVVRLK